MTLAKKGKFQEAANDLFISQSTLSKHIKAMESEMGQILFDRTTRKANLTEFGHQFFPIAVQIATLQENYLELINEFSKATPELVIGIASNTTTYTAVIHPLVELLQKNTNRKISIVEDSEAKLKELLWIKECELLLLYQTLDSIESDFNQLRVFDDELVLIVPNSHPFAKKDRISISELKDSSFVMLQPNSFFYNITHRACGEAGFEPICNVHVSRQTIMYDSIREGAGIALHSKRLATFQLERNSNYMDCYTIVELDESIKFSYNILYRKYSTLSDDVSASLDAFCEHLKTVFSQLL